MTMRIRNEPLNDTHVRCIFLGTFLQHPCIQQEQCSQIKNIYEKYSKHIHCLKKYMSTQFQSNELQILYECSYNNPGMS